MPAPTACMVPTLQVRCFASCSPRCELIPFSAQLRGWWDDGVERSRVSKPPWPSAHICWHGSNPKLGPSSPAWITDICPPWCGRPAYMGLEYVWLQVLVNIHAQRRICPPIQGRTECKIFEYLRLPQCARHWCIPISPSKLQHSTPIWSIRQYSLGRHWARMSSARHTFIMSFSSSILIVVSASCHQGLPMRSTLPQLPSCEEAISIAMTQCTTLSKPDALTRSTGVSPPTSTMSTLSTLCVSWHLHFHLRSAVCLIFNQWKPLTSIPLQQSVRQPLQV